MSLLVVGLSHRSTPLEVLEAVSVSGDDTVKLLRDVVASPAVAEAMVVSTCNRLEVYVDATRFHAAVDAVTERIGRQAGTVDLRPHLYVHYEDAAVQHLFSVTAGMDSMVVGESQVLGQVREALRLAQENATAGRVINDVVQTALRVGKRAHTDTAIDAAGASMVTVGLGLAPESLGEEAGRRALVVGAGAMASLCATNLAERGVHVTIANRHLDRAERLAAKVGGAAVPIADIPRLLADVDIAVSCTGALGFLITTDDVTHAMAQRGSRQLFLLDLALPRDIDPAVHDIAGVTLVDLAAVGEIVDERGDAADDIDDVRRIVESEVEAYLDARHADRVTPTVVALRARATQIVEAEVERFRGRHLELDAAMTRDIDNLVQRVVDKLLHAPTVRVREASRGPNGDVYAQALHHLFDLDPRAIEAVTAVAPDDGSPQ